MTFPRTRKLSRKELARKAAVPKLMAQAEKCHRTLAQARAGGFEFYIARKPCKNGHTSPRSLFEGCHECHIAILQLKRQQRISAQLASPTQRFRREYNLLYVYFTEYVPNQLEYLRDIKTFEEEIDLGFMAEIDAPNLSTSNYLVDGFLNSRGNFVGMNVTNPTIHRALLLRFLGRVDMYTETTLTLAELRAELYPDIPEEQRKDRHDADVIRGYQKLREFLRNTGYINIGSKVHIHKRQPK